VDPEGWDVFEKWFKEMEGKILSLVTEEESAAPAELAARLGVPGDILKHFLRKMVREGRIEIIRIGIRR
jgi:Mn-dependent DtxR family transcriptional regulator